MRGLLSRRPPRPRPRLGLNADPNVIPFIDVMLVLLVIFMVTAPRPQTDLTVNLPTRANTVTHVADLPTTVSVSGAAMRWCWRSTARW